MNDVELSVEVRKTSIDVIQFKCAIRGWIVDSTWGKIDGHYSSVGELQRHCYCPVNSSEGQRREWQYSTVYTSSRYQNLRESVKI